MDFLRISTRSTRRGTIEIYPKFIIKKSSDLMIRGGDFYAIWVEDRGLWSTDEQDALQLIDRELDEYAKENRQSFDSDVKVLHMWDAESGMIDNWHKYCQRQMRDSFHMLDEKLIFSNTKPSKTDYASKTLSYPLEKGDLTAYNRLMSVLYSDEERHKIEWAVGSIVSGDSKKLQKFMVLYGSVGTGKSTVLNIIQQLFEGYYCTFEAKSLGSSNSAFALEAFRSNPLVAIQHDGDLSRIEDNTRLNSLVSHEQMIVNEKFKSAYSNSFKCFLFMGTNRPVKITDAKSGLIRRLIDVSPSGEKLPLKEYRNITEQIKFELGAIAYHCREVYQADPHAYDNYIPIAMMGASNDFYNFVLDSFHIFRKQNNTTLKAAWEMYKTYCEEAKVPHPLSMRPFAEELKNYFRNYEERPTLKDGSRPRRYYSGFRTDRFQENSEEKGETMARNKDAEWIKLDAPLPKTRFDGDTYIFDCDYSDYPAQYASESGKPMQKWSQVTTTLGDLDTGKLHYVKLPKKHIVIDFDIPDSNGNKSLELNLAAANKWPPTYAELSKSGAGIHLHYIYEGDVTKLSRVYADHIEIKVFTGNSSLRRKLTKCNHIPIRFLSSGLPLSEKGDKMVNAYTVKSERGLRSLIQRNLNKEIHPGTKPSIDFIYKILEDAQSDGLTYDISDMQNAVLAFAAGSTHNADYCIKQVGKMKFKSVEASENEEDAEAPLVFYDVEVFPNLFLVCWKAEGEGKPVIWMFNPSPGEIEDLMRLRLVGFNCRRYDNHLLYGRLMGYDEEQLYNLSQRIISGKKDAFFGEAYNVSYTDVYDFSSKKQSLKKFEIELGIHHQELGLPWDKPVPRELWDKVAEYCGNDVIATEAVFNARKSDFVARQILADVAGMTVNDTTNSLTTRIIFGKNRNPQDTFNYRDMGEETANCRHLDYIIGDGYKLPIDAEYAVFDEKNRPIFPGYKIEAGKSTYRGEEVGEGGYVYSVTGMYGNVALLDINSMHPSTIKREELFGPEYTPRFNDILDARLAIKHKDFEKARKMLGGALAKYLTDEKSAKDLAQALKIAINSVYGLTAASFDNPFRDRRNKDNIVAKRGALFMVNLKHEVQRRGYTVAHIKTDSIKIPDADEYIINFVKKYGELYGYTFEHEATYDRMCLVNDAVYIAKYKDGEHAGEWTATGTQFQVPYVFKKLFSKENICFEDMCETKSVSKGALYLDMNEGLPDVKSFEKELAKIQKEAGADGCLPFDLDEHRMKLQQEIAAGHDYHFIGRVGQFCPIKPGCGGGDLVRESDGKYFAAAGTKDYKWLESEMVRTLDKQDDINRTYYDKLVDEAVKTISNFGDYEWFVSDDPYVPAFPPDDDDLPF